MDTGTTYVWGWRILRRYPWLVALPLLGDLLRIGLSHALLSVIPSTANRHLLWPGLLPSSLEVGLSQSAGSTPLPLLPQAILLLGSTLLGSLLLGCLGEVLGTGQMGPRGSLRRALRALPWLLLFAGAQWGLAWPGIPASASILRVLLLLVLPLFPFTSAVLGMGPLAALRTAPALLWSHLGRWLYLLLGNAVAFMFYTLLVLLVGKGHVWFILLTYPVLGSLQVAAIAVLCHHLANGAAPAQPVQGGVPRPLWLLGGAAAWAIATWAGSLWLGDLRACSAINEAPQQPVAQCRYIERTHAGWRIIFERGDQLGIAEVASEWYGGWSPTSATWTQEATPSPAVWLLPPYATGGDAYMLVGKVMDGRATYLQVRDARIRLGEPGTFVILHEQGSLPTRSEIKLLDAKGQPIADQPPAPF